MLYFYAKNFEIKLGTFPKRKEDEQEYYIKLFDIDASL